MIRVGIVGTNYGRQVLLPAFRVDPRCEVVALAGADGAKAAEAARQAGIPRAFGDWAEMIERAGLDAVAVATPPRRQPDIAVAALRRGLPVFAEKPMAADLAGARAMVNAAGSLTTMIDFNFTEIAAWRKAKAMLEAGAIGRLRHVSVTWLVENASTRLRLKNWKTGAGEGGGALGNLASHAMHYLEWFCGPVDGLAARLFSLPDDASLETGVNLSLSFRSGAAGTFAMSCAAYLGSGHRLEFYGEDGTLVLSNPTADYMRGFELRHGRRPDGRLAPIEVGDDPVDRRFPEEARIAPVSRLVGRFLDAVASKQPASPGFAEGFRAQVLLDAVRRSHDTGRWVEIAERETA